MENDTAKTQLMQAAQAQKLHLPMITESWMHLHNTVLAHKLAFTLPLDSGLWQCSTRHVCLLPKKWQCLLYINIGGYMCDCYLENLAPLAKAPLNASDFPFMPKELLHIILQSLLQNLLQNLSEILGYTCELHDFTLFDIEQEQYDASTKGLLFTLAHTEDASSTTCAYITNMSTQLHTIFLDFAKQYIDFEQDFALPAHMAQARINLHIVWQTKQLNVQDIQDLAVGDCLLLPPQNEHMAVNLCVPQTNFMAKAQLDIQKKEIILENYMQNTLYENEEIPQETSEENLYANPVQCPIPVQCHLGSVSLSIDDLSKLSPGMVLGPMEGLDAPVQICVGNACIGRGSLVDIEGRIGVQVAEIFKK